MQEPGFGAPIPPPTGDVYSPVGSSSGINDSGTGATAQLPAELRGFNVGAFFLSWIWAIAHNSWIGLIALIPYIGFIMAIILGFKGNEWAWQNRKWDSIEQFKATQKVWTKWGIILVGIATLIWVAFFVLTIMGNNVKSSFNSAG